MHPLSFEGLAFVGSKAVELATHCASKAIRYEVILPRFRFFVMIMMVVEQGHTGWSEEPELLAGG